MKDMLDKIVQIEKRYVELGQTLSDPNVIADYNKFRDLSKQRMNLCIALKCFSDTVWQVHFIIILQNYFFPYR